MIKKYKNRKYYNTKTKKYVTLREVAASILEDGSRVIDQTTKNDITASTLSRAIAEAYLDMGVLSDMGGLGLSFLSGEYSKLTKVLPGSTDQ